MVQLVVFSPSPAKQKTNQIHLNAIPSLPTPLATPTGHETAAFVQSSAAANAAANAAAPTFGTAGDRDSTR